MERVERRATFFPDCLPFSDPSQPTINGKGHQSPASASASPSHRTPAPDRQQQHTRDGMCWQKGTQHRVRTSRRPWQPISRTRYALSDYLTRGTRLVLASTHFSLRSRLRMTTLLYSPSAERSKRLILRIGSMHNQDIIS
jgi:hypothetical protein